MICSNRKYLPPLTFAASGTTWPSGGLFASTFRFKFAGKDVPSIVSKFRLLLATFFAFPFLPLGLAKSSLPTRLVGDAVYVGRRKEDTAGKPPILSAEKMATAATAMEHSIGNFTMECIMVRLFSVKDKGTLVNGELL